MEDTVKNCIDNISMILYILYTNAHTSKRRL